MWHALLLVCCLLGQTVGAFPRPRTARVDGWPPVAGLVPGPSYGTGRTAGGFVASVGDLVIRAREDPTPGLETYMVGSRDRIAEVAFASLWENRIERLVMEHFASGMVVLMGDGDLVALDPRTLRPRWHRRLVPREVAVRWNGPELMRAYSASGAIVTVLRSSAPRAGELVVLAVASGEIVWRRELRRSGDSIPAIAVSSQRVAWIEGSKIFASAVSDGRRLWTADVPAGTTYLVANDEFVVAEVEGRGQSDLIVIDASTGAGLRHEAMTDEGIHQVAIDGETLLLA